ncbi:poly-like [Tropilaelaps mercedesae]|uniref:Poly [ADP-ribose] polymerase n=1 Tax=Tropilaelaps mercedesae TaxID=418985 RepID=A0A1V9X2T2_9ACAR|nr:poly-like [Tropilaelaps mercedesae]
MSAHNADMPASATEELILPDLADDSEATEVVIRPAPIGDEPDEIEGSDQAPSDEGPAEEGLRVKQEPIDETEESLEQEPDTLVNDNAGVSFEPFHATNVTDAFTLPGVHIKEEPANEDLEDEENSQIVASRRGANCTRSPAASNYVKVERKRRAREEILYSEKKFKEERSQVFISAKERRPVDPECEELQGQASIYTENGDIYDVMLNQTNVEFNNNKYYLLQLVKANSRNQYYVWFRWGRVGKKGQNNLIPCANNLDKAKDIFKKKFFDKTLNEFDERHYFVKVKGKYDLVQVCADETDSQRLKEEVAKLTATSKTEVTCSLEPKLRSLIELICNVKNMEGVLKQLNFDPKRSPLGKLTKQQIAAGYTALKTIEDCVSNGIRGARLTQACNDFYTRIPHDFGMRAPPLICSYEEIREKIDLLEALTDVQFAVELLRRKMSTDNLHPIDQYYISLHTRLIKVSQDEFDLLFKFLRTTHAPTHQEYVMNIMSAFVIDKREEVEGFNSRLSNRMLLWHGSRLSNWASIISQGLRVAPPEAPVTGYMFGKGIYFADSSSKSANYCFPTRAQDEGLLLLSEVALGKVNELYEANYEAHRLPKGKHSVKGMGRMVPSKETFIKISSPHDGHPVVVPCGELRDISNQKQNRRSRRIFTLNYNEYVVYNVNQIKMRYILRVKFTFN